MASFQKIKNMLFKGEEELRGEGDESLWFRDLVPYSYGKYSYASVQANQVMEDYSKIIPGPDATFVGIYDGHNGAEASEFVSDNFSKTLLGRVRNSRTTVGKDIEYAFEETERGFMEKIVDFRRTCPMQVKNLATVGSCCLVGVMRKRELSVGNLGTSKAVLGWYRVRDRSIRATQLMVEHGIKSPSDRRQPLGPGYHMLNKTTPKVDYVNKDGVWLIRGIQNLQTKRAIGDAFMKDAKFKLPYETSPFYVEPIGHYPMISAEPNIPPTIKLRPIIDRFIVFASGGFWDHFTNDEVVDIVHKKPKKGIARRLIVSAMENAAGKKGIMTYDAVKEIPAGEERRAVHDDMTVIVLFIDFTKFYLKPSDDLCTMQAFAGGSGSADFKLK